MVQTMSKLPYPRGAVRVARHVRDEEIDTTGIRAAASVGNHAAVEVRAFEDLGIILQGLLALPPLPDLRPRVGHNKAPIRTQQSRMYAKKTPKK